MSTPKGYTSQTKEDRLKAEFVTIQPVTPERFALETVANAFAFVVASDTVGSYANSIITAPGHLAEKGDIIKFTSGALNNRQFTVWEATTNTITLAQTPGVDPAAADSFSICRYTPAAVTSTGGLAVGLSFTRNGASQEVTEDTVTPANNRPLPVKITGLDGDVVINSSNLNLEVQLSAAGADYDSVRLGDGTNTAVFGAGANSAATLRTTPATDAPHLLATRHEAAATPIATRKSNGTNFDSYNTGSADATTPRVVLCDRHEAASSPLSVRISNGTGFSSPQPAGRTKADGPWRHDYAVNVTTIAYTQIDASTSADINRLMIFDSSGQTMALATGAGGAEVIQLYIPPGGIDVDMYIPAGTRISIIAISATASAGEIVINALT